MLGLNGTDLENVCDGICKTKSSLCANETLVHNGTNVTSNETDEAEEFITPHSLWLTIVIGIVPSIVIIVTVLGNILVLFSFVLERSLRQPTNFFIASLAISDLLIGISSMPVFILYRLVGYWPLGEIICDILLSLDWTVCLASQFTVFFITIDRFCSVKIPAKYRNWRTGKKIKVMISLSWIFPSLIFFTTIIGWKYFVNERTRDPKACEVQFMDDPLFTFLLTIGYYWTPLIVMISLYVGIYRVVLAIQRKSNEQKMKINHLMGFSYKSFVSKRETKPEESKKQVHNENAWHLSDAQKNNSLATGFIRHPDNECFKFSEEDRSSNHVFASDKDKGSSGERCHINNSVQKEQPLKDMQRSSVHHISGLALSLPVTSINATQVTSSGVKDHQHESDHESKVNKKTRPTKFKSENRARRALRKISIILGAYVLCWTPYHVLVFIIGICGDKNCINLNLYYFTYWLCYFNSAVNPFCYAFANAAFKRTFIRILKCDYHRT